jgi:hypothetical protein
VRQRGVADVEQPAHVDRHHALPLLERRVDDRTVEHHPGGVDDDVEPPVFGDDARHGTHGVVALGEIGGDDLRAAELGGERVEPVRPARDERNRGALIRERPRRRLADTAARTGDERDGAVERSRHAAVCSIP